MFAAKAAEMLQKHNLQEADLAEEQKQGMVREQVSSVDWNPWRIDLIQSLAKLYFSDIYLTREIHKEKLRRAVVVVGREHNVEIVRSMYEYLEKTTMRLAGEYSRERKYRLHFEKGCGGRVAFRLREMIPAEDAPPIQLEDGNFYNLPALYKSEKEEVDDMIQGITLGKMARSSGHRTGSSATLAGRAAGDKVNLGKQIGGASGSKLLT